MRPEGLWDQSERGYVLRWGLDSSRGLVREEAKAGASDGLEMASRVPLLGRPWRLPVGVNQRE